MKRSSSSEMPWPSSCADTYDNACAAAEKVKVDLEVLPAYMSAPAAMEEDALEIHPGTPNIYYIQNLEKGDPTGPIFESAPVTVEDDFYVGAAASSYH